jgi:3',5'-cyclic AMP phosphodiesterase CpdA
VRQYELACQFVERIEAGGLPVLAVPGNHDVPLYDIVRRFVRPLNRYRRFIDDDLCPFWEDAEVAALGINTARSLTIKDGSVSYEQMHIIRETFNAVSDGKLHILVTHHPLYAMPLGEEGALTKVARRNEDALAAAADAGVDILLAGHFHRTFHKSAREMVETAGPALVIQAGTATSTRLRGGEQQSFNWIEARKGEVALQVFAWENGAFVGGRPVCFTCDDGSWRMSSAEVLEDRPGRREGERPLPDPA